MIPFSARNRLGASSAPDFGHIPARKAVGIPFRAGKDTFFCPEPLRSTFCAGFGAFSCPEGGWYPVLRQKNTIFVAEPRRRTPSQRNATCGTNIWWRARKNLPKKEICAKVFLFLESAIFEKRNGGKFTLLWSSRMLGADPPVRRPASPHTSRAAATLYVRGLWGTTLSLRGRVVQRFPECSRRMRMLLHPKWLIL